MDICHEAHIENRYGFRNVITPADIFVACPSIWPFSSIFASYYKGFARSLPRPIDPLHPTESLKIGTIFVFNDPRDWALDAHVILDLLLSSQGILGTYSSKNDNPHLPNRGFQQDGQPRLYFSNPDLWWAAQYHLPRLGQGGFREALEGIWRAVTGGKEAGVELHKTIIGKPYRSTFEFAEKKLNQHRQTLLHHSHPTEKDKGQSPSQSSPLRTIYFVGDNPESDIRGANEYISLCGSKWVSILVKTGVYNGRQPDRNPSFTTDDVQKAVQWGLKRSGWSSTMME